MNKQIQAVALGGILAALAIVVMCLGTLIPFAAYVCPVVCILLQMTVSKKCGKKLAWAWYTAVMILSLLLCPEKESAVLFLLLGYYPIVKPCFDRAFLGVIWKLLYFNAAVILLYVITKYILGIEDTDHLSQVWKTVSTIAILLLGNFTFGLLDKLLTKLTKGN